MNTFHHLKWISDVELDLLHRWVYLANDINDTNNIHDKTQTEYLFVESSQDTCMSRSIDGKQLLDNTLIQQLSLAYGKWLKSCSGRVTVIDGNMNIKNNDIERQLHLKTLSTQVHALADHFVTDS